MNDEIDWNDGMLEYWNVGESFGELSLVISHWSLVGAWVHDCMIYVHPCMHPCNISQHPNTPLFLVGRKRMVGWGSPIIKHF
jgi:hypothetical protein